MRFRLLSYVAAMLLLAGVLGMNLTPLRYAEYASFLHPDVDVIDDDENRPVAGLSDTTFVVEYGWPFLAATGAISCFDDFTSRREESCPPFDEMNRTWHLPALAANIAIGLAIPIAGLFACEFVLRRWGRTRVDNWSGC